VHTIREKLNKQFPDCTFFVQPSDMVGQILNFGLPAPIDIQIIGRNFAQDYLLAQELSERLRTIPGRWMCTSSRS